MSTKEQALRRAVEDFLQLAADIRTALEGPLRRRWAELEARAQTLLGLARIHG
jgi:hypothetical protein